MIQYLGGGRRDYRRQPVRTHRRGRWEFQAILDGEATLTLPRGERVVAGGGPTLFICGPECAHGWAGGEHPCEVAVFHFADVPAEVKGMVPASGWRALRLDEAGGAAMRRRWEEARRESERPRAWSPLQSQRILIELSLEVVRRAEEEADADGGLADKARVDRMIAWYLARLPENPSFEAAARAAAVSGSHARRLFHAVLGCSPREVLARMRFQRAAQLIETTDEPLAAVAAAVGFSEASAFSRAFKQHFGVSPSRWR